MHSPIPDEMLFWRNAIPLGQAALRFAPKHLKEKWQHSQTQSALKTASEAMEKAKAETVENRPSFQELMKPAQDILSDRAKVLSDCDYHLLRHLQSGALRTFAFESPRSLASNALELPQNTWHQHHNLNRNQINFESICYQEVRVISAEQTAEILEKKQSYKRDEKQRGRPSAKSEIVRAFNALHGAGRIDPLYSAKSHFSIIRNWLSDNAKDLSIDPRKINDETIRRAISPLFNALKTPTNKQ